MKFPLALLVILATLCDLEAVGYQNPPEKSIRYIRIVPIRVKDNSLPRVSPYATFDDFIAQTGRIYHSEAEYHFREEQFLNYKRMVGQNNNGAYPSAYKLALNAFSDYTSEDFTKKLLGVRKTNLGESKRKNQTTKNDKLPRRFPTYVDWRQYGGVTPAKLQGDDCGACWAFPVTGAIEGHMFRKTRQLISLSEQNLIDCSRDFGNEGCDGGFQEYGFEYVMKNKGISRSNAYPNILANGKCHYKETYKGALIKGYETIPPGDEAKLQEVIATLGPVACSIHATQSFLLYSAGIYMDNACQKEEPNHSVLVVGYGSDERGRPYWIIKNSWSDTWGENGFAKIPRGRNFCSIAEECSYPYV